MLDIFDRIERDSGGPIGQYFEQGFGYYMYPRLEGELGPHMTFNGIPVLNWSLNNWMPRLLQTGDWPILWVPG